MQIYSDEAGGDLEIDGPLICLDYLILWGRG